MKRRPNPIKPFVHVSMILILAIFIFIECFIATNIVNAQVQLVNHELFSFTDVQPDAALRPVITGMAVKNSQLYVGADDRNIYQIDLNAKTSPKLFSSKSGKAWIRAVAVSPTQDVLASLSQDGELRFWNLQTRNIINTVSISKKGVHDLSYSHDGRVLAVCGFDTSVPLIDSNTHAVIRTLNTPKESSTVIRFSNNDKKIAVGGRWGVRVWDMETSAFHDFTRDLPNTEAMRRVRAVAFSPDDKMLAVGGDFSVIYIFDLSTNKLVKTLSLPPFASQTNSSVTGAGKVYSLTFCGNSNQLASGDSLNRVLLWDLNSLHAQGQTEIPGISATHTGTIATLLYVDDKNEAPDVPCLISSGFDTTVRIWKLE